MDVIEIGSPFWKTEDVQNNFDEFALIYSKAPVNDNAGGMKAPHAFASWFMLKMLQPKTIIESGVWKGQGTWLLEQACPSADIISLDINLGNLIYRSPKATYIEKDFSLVDLSNKKRRLLQFEKNFFKHWLRKRKVWPKGLQGSS